MPALLEEDSDRQRGAAAAGHQIEGTMEVDVAATSKDSSGSGRIAGPVQLRDPPAEHALAFAASSAAGRDGLCAHLPDSTAQASPRFGPGV
jgi:hypothetical protein